LVPPLACTSSRSSCSSPTLARRATDIGGCS
jgi:hypothetical protein